MTKKKKLDSLDIDVISNGFVLRGYDDCMDQKDVKAFYPDTKSLLEAIEKLLK